MTRDTCTIIARLFHSEYRRLVRRYKHVETPKTWDQLHSEEQSVLVDTIEAFQTLVEQLFSHL